MRASIRCFASRLLILLVATGLLLPSLRPATTGAEPGAAPAGALAWAAAAPLPPARAGLAVATAGGRLYALGGASWSQVRLGAVEAYDPATNTWATRAPLPTARWGLGAAAGPDGRLY